MIDLPDFSESRNYENIFYLTCNTQLISKFVAHLELYKKVMNLAGEIVECGVFPGETKAVDEFFGDYKLEILKFPFAMTPSYVIVK